MLRYLVAGICAWTAVRGDAAVPPIDPPGFRPQPAGFHALTNALVFSRPGVQLRGATLVISNGWILSVQTNAPPPPRARVWDLKGATIYPGLVEPWLPWNDGGSGSDSPGPDNLADDVDARADLTPGGPRYFGVPGEELDPGTPGPGARSPEVTPEYRLGTRYVPRTSVIESLREQGFATAQIVPENGIFRGQAAVVLLGDRGPNASVLRPDSAQCIGLDLGKRRSGGRGQYPGSLMGVVSLLRQTFLDEEFHREYQEFHRKNPSLADPPLLDLSLEALSAVRRGQPVIFDPGSVLMVHRVNQLATEMGLTNRTFLASGHEWRRPDLLAHVSGSFIVRLDLPEVPKLTEESDWDQVTLDQLRAWDWAPENPQVIQRAGKTLALTTDGLRDRKDFRKNLRVALDRGLSEEDALAALTVVPAAIAGVADLVGTIEPGRLANLVVVDGSYFDPESKVKAVWVQGVPFLLNESADSPAKDRPSGNPSDSSEQESRAKPESRSSSDLDQRSELTELRSRRTAREPLADRGALASPDLLVLTNATLWTCGPEGILGSATLRVVNGRIDLVRAGSAGVEIPENAMVIDATGFHVTPGLIDCHSHSMILGSVNESTLPSTAMVRVRDVVNSESPNIRRQLAGGLTLANLLHGSANPIGGQSCVIKLKDGAGPDELRFSKAPEGIKFALGENVKQSNWGERQVTRFPQSRMGVPTFYRNRFMAAQRYAEERRRSAGDRHAAPVRRDLEMDTLVEILEGTRWIHCHSYRQDEILVFLRTMEDFGIQVGTLQHILEGYKVADEIARHGAGASAFSDWWAYKFEVIDAIPYAGSLLRDRGVNVSFNSDSDDHARRLNLEAAKAVKYGGTPPEEALKFVTINPARQLRIDPWVGSLEVGKDADFVIWSGDPLDSRSICLQTWIEGRKYFDRDQDRNRTETLAREREELLAKARRLSGRSGRHQGSEEARARFFRSALETARHLGVLNCQDCVLP